jgi:hypothetical protein
MVVFFKLTFRACFWEEKVKEKTKEEEKGKTA